MLVIKMLSLIKSTYRKLQRPETEAVLWIAGLIYLFIINPYEAQHYTFCAFKLVGIDDCPGCGLGNSISMILHGDLTSPFSSHPLGIFALTVIVFRIFTLLSNSNPINKIKRRIKNGRRIKTIT